MPDTYNYTELSPQDRNSVIEARMRDLEAQHLQIAVRINAPALGETTTQADQDALTQLETSLATLKAEVAANNQEIS